MRRCGLPFQRLGQFSRALLLRLEQAGVLDSNYRLVGKSSNQVDFLLIEWLYPISRKDQHADWCVQSHEGDAERRTKAANGCRSLMLIFCVAHNVGELHRPSFEQTAAGNG